jgi:hypothetical protein
MFKVGVSEMDSIKKAYAEGLDAASCKESGPIPGWGIPGNTYKPHTAESDAWTRGWNDGKSGI